MARAAGAPAAQAAAAEDARLASTGQELIRRLKDPEVDPQELLDLVGGALARGELAGALRARDEIGRSPLHVAATRGDLHLCRRMLEADPSLVNAADKNKTTPCMDAAHLGRALILRELIRHGADVTRTNADLMSALQLACVSDGSGSGEVVQALVEAGADPAAVCWQATPLMAAADSGHIWAVQALIDMGADPWQTNGSSLTALDFVRDLETAQLLYDVMQGDRLSDKPAPRFDTQGLFKDAEERRAKLHRAVREYPLADALAALEVPPEWLPEFVKSGARFNEIRKAWRRACLRCHPDKQPEHLEEEAAAEWTARFLSAAAAFEAVERHHRAARADEEL